MNHDNSISIDARVESNTKYKLVSKHGLEYYEAIISISSSSSSVRDYEGVAFPFRNGLIFRNYK